MTIVRFNVSRMFADREPWDCSNSVANLGPRAGELTWAAALAVVGDCSERPPRWLMSELDEALRYVQAWAKETGAWDREEREAWTVEEQLALLVQNVASDLRSLGSDDLELYEAVELYTERLKRSHHSVPAGLYGHYWVHGAGIVMGEVSQ